MDVKECKSYSESGKLLMKSKIDSFLDFFNGI